jgi:hypothetical protein
MLGMRSETRQPSAQQHTQDSVHTTHGLTADTMRKAQEPRRREAPGGLPGLLSPTEALLAAGAVVAVS